MKCKIAVLVASAVLGLAGFTTHAQTRIMPFGDSVTSSQSGHNSYRFWLWQYLVNKGYQVDFVGTRSGVGNNEAPLDPTWTDNQHEGYPGAASDFASAHAFGLASVNQPDIVLLDFGGNDIDEIPPEQTQANLQSAVEDLRAVNPDVIVVMAVPMHSVGEPKTAGRMMRQAVSRAAHAEKKLGARIYLVNLSGISPTHDTYDGMHPNDRGEQKIAKKYFSVVRRFAAR